MEDTLRIPCDINSLIYFDIETIPNPSPSVKTLEDLRRLKPIPVDENGFEQFSDTQWFKNNGSLYAEFGRIVCISAGVIREGTFRTKSFSNIDEKTLLEEFFAMVFSFEDRISGLCGHNVKGFDAPFVAKRAAVNGIMKVPKAFELFNVKPWESLFLDTAELWKSGQFGSPAKLDMLCSLLDIPSPKSDMDGSGVLEAYTEGRIADIVIYCEADVLATARLLQRLTQGYYDL